MNTLYESGLFASPADEPMHPGGLRLTDRAARLAGLSGGMRALDLGCGAGAVAAYLAARYGLDITGLDASEALLETGRRAHPDLKLLHWEAGALPFGNEAFDAVLLECVLSVIGKTDFVLTECARILGSSGVLIVSDVVSKCAASSCGEQLPTASALSRLITDAGFSVSICEDHTPALKTFVAALYERGVMNLDDCAFFGGCVFTRPRIKDLGYTLLIARRL